MAQPSPKPIPEHLAQPYRELCDALALLLAEAWARLGEQKEARP